MAWKLVDPSTFAMEITGVGVVVRINGHSANAVTSCFVPGARILVNPLAPGAKIATHRIVRENRNAPPVDTGVTADDIAKRARPDEGAKLFYTQDEPEY